MRSAALYSVVFAVSLNAYAAVTQVQVPLDFGRTITVYKNIALSDFAVSQLVLQADRSTKTDCTGKPAHGLFEPGDRVFINDNYLAWFDYTPGVDTVDEHGGALSGFWSLSAGTFRFKRTGPNGCQWAHNELVRGSASPNNQNFWWDKFAPAWEHTLVMKGQGLGGNAGVAVFSHSSGKLSGVWENSPGDAVEDKVGFFHFKTLTRLVSTHPVNPPNGIAIDVTDNDDTNGVAAWVQSEVEYIMRSKDIVSLWRIRPFLQDIRPNCFDETPDKRGPCLYEHLWGGYSFDEENTVCDGDRDPNTRDYPNDNEIYGKSQYVTTSRFRASDAPILLDLGTKCSRPLSNPTFSVESPQHEEWIQWWEDSNRSTALPHMTFTLFAPSDAVGDGSYSNPFRFKWRSINYANETNDGVLGGGGWFDPPELNPTGVNPPGVGHLQMEKWYLAAGSVSRMPAGVNDFCTSLDCLPPPPNHTIDFGYYYVDGKYGDFRNEVNCYTDLYYALAVHNYPSGVDWWSLFQQSLQNSASDNKAIHLNLNWDVVGADMGRLLDTVAPFWGRVVRIEMQDEPDWTISQAENNIAQLRSMMAARGLGDRPVGIVFTRNQVLTGDTIFASGLDWVGIECYVDPPGSPSSQVNIDALNSFVDQAKARVPGSKKLVYVIMAYDRNGAWTNMDTLRDLQAVPYQRAFDDPRVVAITMFSYGRPGGSRDHPELTEVHKEIAQAIFGSGTGTGCSPPPPPILPPTDPPILSGPQGCVTSVRPTFTWSAVPRATQYRIVVSPADVDNFFIDRFVSGTSLVSPVELTVNKEYRFKVRGTNAAGIGPWSTISYFTPFCGGAVTNITSPLGCVASTAPTFTWLPVTGADNYWLLAAPTPDFSAGPLVVNVNTGTQTSYSPGAVFTPNTTYYAKVKTHVAPDSVAGGWSPTISFTPGCTPQPPLSRPGGPYVGTTGLPIQFDGSTSSDPDGTVVSYLWSFGDGGSATGARPTHAFALDGLYTVTLTVTDNSGMTDRASTTADTRPPAPGEPVVWTNVVGVSVSGNNLTNTAAVDNWTSGASSTRAITSGNGGVAFRVAETNTYRMLGLSHLDVDAGYRSLDFAIYTTSAGTLFVYESGASAGSFGTYATGDVLEIVIQANTVRYKRNGVIFYSSAGRPVFPLVVDTSLYSLGAATINQVTLSGSLGPAPPIEKVAWTNATGVTVSGNNLTGNGPDGWSSGAFSTRGIASGDGFATFMAKETNTYRMLGLSHADAGSSYTTIDFALYATAAGTLMVYEKGASMGQFGTYAAGDRLEVAIRNGVVQYLNNGTLLYTSTQVPVYPLYVDTSLYSSGATIRDATIGGQLTPEIFSSSVPIVWTNTAGVSVSGSSLTKTAVAGWGNAGASSTKAIASGDGYAEFTATDTVNARMLGLSHMDVDQMYGSIDFALYATNKLLQVYERGELKGSFGAYALGDRLRVAVQGGVVSYLRNGTVFYTSTQAPSYPLVADVAIYSPSSGVTDAAMAGLLADSAPIVPVSWTKAVGVSISGNSLTMTAPSGWGNAGASSTQAIASGDGFVDFLATENSSARMVGFSRADPDASYTSIEFALYAATTVLQVYERGVLRGTFGSYAPGDHLQVVVTSGVVRYQRNGMVLYTSSQVPAYPLLVDTALYPTGYSIDRVMLSGQLVSSPP